MKNFVLAVMLIFACSAFVTGCASLTGETAGQNIDDSTIHTQVTAVIVQDPAAHYLKIDVAVTKGDVVLTGFVNSSDTEQRLVAKIREIKGVKSVKSLLKIEEKK